MVLPVKSLTAPDVPERSFRFQGIRQAVRTAQTPIFS